MANIFLDTNIFIDLVEKRGKITADDLNAHNLFISPLSIHILLYVIKQKVPYLRLLQIVSLFSVIPLDKGITTDALNGPTKDFEDNTQLHSAAQAECELFLTEDKKLLDLKFFGKTRILNLLPVSASSAREAAGKT